MYSVFIKTPQRKLMVNSLKKTPSWKRKLNNDWGIDVNINDSRFVIAFPKGSTVTDKWTGENIP